MAGHLELLSLSAGYDGIPVLRYAVADRMQKSCVACHNTHVDSPKKDWQEGDVRGVLEVTTSIEPQLKQNAGLVRVAAFLIGGTALGIVTALQFTPTRW